MNNLIRTLFLLLAFSVTAVAQYDKEKMNEIKEAFIQKKLELTEAEAARFWPVFRRYEAERKALRKAARPDGEKKKFGEMSDAELNKFMDTAMDVKEKELQVQKKYFSEFRKILPANKAVKLLYIEEQFRQFLLKQAQNKDRK